MKKTILVFTDYYLPGNSGGGPIKSVANIVDHLGDEFDFKIITSNHDLNSPMKYSGVDHGSWNDIGNAKVFYLPSGLDSYLTLLKIIRQTPHELRYLNSFFSARFTIYPLFLKLIGLVDSVPYLIAPRGEFSEGALKIKAAKKSLFIRLSKWVGLYKNVFWHASTELEMRDIVAAYSDDTESVFKSPILLARDLVSVSTKLTNADSVDKAGGRNYPLSICFFSRISPKKNLDYALQALAKVMIPVHFTIYGPKEDQSYWAECQALINGLPENIVVLYGGAVDAADVNRTLARHDLMFVPTLGENFGHVFVEAWAAGTPVLISDQTPWRNLYSQNLGWEFPLKDINLFVEAIHEAANTSPENRMKLRKACRDFAQEIMSDPKSIESNRSMFLKAIGKR